MATEKSFTEDELIANIQTWQNTLNELTSTLQHLKLDCVNKLRRGGTAGSSITSETHALINSQITNTSLQVQAQINRLVDSLCATFQVKASGAISSGDLITTSNVASSIPIAKFAGVSDASDMPYAWWIGDTNVYYIATEVNPDSDLQQILNLAADDVVLVQDSDAATDDSQGAGVQRGRRLKIVGVSDNQTHNGTSYFGILELDDDVSHPYAFRDLGQIDGIPDTRAKDTSLILRKVYDASV